MLENQVETTEKLEVAAEASTTVVTQEVAMMLIANAKKLKGSGPGIKLDADYFEFKKVGDSTRGVFVGFAKAKFKADNFDQANPEYRELDAVKWISEEADGSIKTWICSSAALVRTIQENNIQTGTGLEITMTDDKGGNNKKVKLFEVSILNLG